MNKIKTIIKYELVRYFLSPLAYVYLISFLLLSGSCAIYFGHFFMDGRANLWALFAYQPWIYLLFIPGISMRSWSEEFRSKSIIQTLTLPVKISDIVWGKFFASWLFAIGAIFLTFPLWITVNVLGKPDNGVIFIGYLGCFILSGAMLAISQTMSAVSKNPVIALVLGVFVNLLFFWSSFEYVLFWARELFSDVIVDTIISFSFWGRFFSLSRGLIEFRDLIFFGSLIIFFNVLTIFIVGLKTRGNSSIISSLEPKHSFVYIFLLLVGFFSVNIIANNVFRQISYDFTEEKYLSLTKNTKDVLRKLERPVIAKLYYSPILEKRNPNIRQVFDQVKLLLKQYKSYSNGKFDYRIYNPYFLDKHEDRALADGLQPIPLIDINQNALFGITFADNLTNKSVIPFFSMERLAFLEQDLTTSIYKLHHKKKTIGLLSSLPIAGDIRVENVSMKKWEIFNQISELYNVKVIANEEDFDNKFDVLMIVHPLSLTPSVIEKIKKHQKVLLFLDVIDDASLLYSPLGGNFLTSELGELSDYWGIKFYNTGVAADFDNSIMVDDTTNYSKDPSFTQDLLQFKVKTEDFNPNHRITYRLNEILFSSASMVYVADEKKVSYFPLIKTSKNSAMVRSDVVKNKVSPRDLLKGFAPDNVAIILAAEFLSNDPNKPFDVIAVGDTDFLYDAFWTRQSNFLDKSLYIPLFDNANFVLNALDYLTENDDLISLRGKTIKKRPLDVVDNMRKINLYKYKLKENDIFNAIEGAKYGIKEVVAKREFEKRESFSADELALIGNIRKEINSLRQQLSSLKINANMDIERIEVMVKFFNIYFIALLIIVGILFINLKKKKFSLAYFRNFLFWNKAVSKLLLIVCISVVLAGISVYVDNRNTISLYEGKYVFEDLNKKLNLIKKIQLKGSNNELIFSFKNGKWALDGENLPVYQERIRSFLIALCNMVYYEKKSDRIEDMKFFGFSSLDNKKSPTIEVVLKDDEGNVIKEFDIGWYDIDLGRGSKASFIRLKNQFQVWMVEADFYDLALDKKDWTYSSLWNLRFGRFIEYNNIKDDNKVINLVKNMLNIYVKNVHDDKLDVENIGKIRIKSEDDNFFSILFYKNDNQYFVKYDFIAKPKGKHLKIFANSIKDKLLEITENDWELLKDDATRKE